MANGNIKLNISVTHYCIVLFPVARVASGGEIDNVRVLFGLIDYTRAGDVAKVKVCSLTVYRRAGAVRYLFGCSWVKHD